MGKVPSKYIVSFLIGFFSWAFICHAGWQVQPEPQVTQPAFELTPVEEVTQGISEEDYLAQMTTWVDGLIPQALALINLTDELGEDLHALSRTPFLKTFSEQLADLQGQLSTFPIYSSDELTDSCQASYEAFKEAQIAYEKAIWSLQTTIEYSLLRLDAEALKGSLIASSEQLLDVVSHLEQGLSLLNF